MAPPEARYNVILVGVDRIDGGQAAAAELIAERFQLSERMARKLVRSTPTEVKKSVTREQAERYLSAMREMGCDVQLVAAEGAPALVRTDDSSIAAAVALSGRRRTESGTYRSTRKREVERTPSDLAAAPPDGGAAQVDDGGLAATLPPSRRPGSGEAGRGAATEPPVPDPLEVTQQSARVDAPSDPPSDVGFSSDLEAFVTGDHPAVEANEFALPQQLTGKHRAIGPRPPIDNAPPERGPDDPDTIDDLTEALGMGGPKNRPSLLDELAAMEEGDAPELGAALDGLSSVGVGAPRRKDPPAPEPEPPSREAQESVDALQGLIQRGATDTSEVLRVPDANENSGIALDEAAGVPVEGPGIGMSVSRDLEEQIQSLTASYRAIEGDPRQDEPIDDFGDEEDDFELDLESPPSGAAERAASLRPTSSARMRSLSTTGQQSATEGMYIQTTGGFKPAKRETPWGLWLGVPTLLAALGGAGYFGYNAYQESLPENRFAAATNVYEFEEPIDTITTLSACADTGGGTYLCRFDRWFYAAMLPEASVGLHRAAAEVCYGEIGATGMRWSLDVECDIPMERGSEVQRHRIDVHRSRECEGDLSALSTGERVGCDALREVSHEVESQPVFVRSERERATWEMRREFPLESDAGMLQTIEYVVTPQSGEIERAFYWAEAGLVARRRGFSGERVFDITYRRSPAGTAGTPRIVER